MKWLVSRKIKSKNSGERKREIVESLLASRCLKTSRQKAQFFEPSLPEKLTAREIGVSVPELKKAIKRIVKAVKDKEKIVVYGDYDTDGVCATAIVWETLEKIGADARPFIPVREEGYGLKVERLDKLIKEGVSLVITVDEGIVQNRQVIHAQKKGLDIIITDHHQPGKTLPKARAIIHTTSLAGAGVAWFFAKEILAAPEVKDLLPPKSKKNAGAESVLDLATIGTVADMVPLLGANRSLVFHGLRAVQKTKRLGLLALFELAAISPRAIGTYETGFLIGPRLNASGRMEDPMDALRLVCTRDPVRATKLARMIEDRNRDRQRLTEQTVAHARELWLKEDGHSPLIFIHHETYQEGVVGLVASRLKEEFFRPAVVLSRGEVWSKASARSIKNFNIIEAVRACAADLGSHGGHPLAAGFSVETSKIILVKDKLLKLAQKELDTDKLRARLKVDAEIKLSDCTPELYREIEKFAPFGVENPMPVFCSRQVRVIEAKTVGRDGKHLKLIVGDQSRSSTVNHPVIAFNFGRLISKTAPGKTIDIAYQLWENEWNGQKRLQLKAKDIKIPAN